jgi:RND family efflux transporter MFP subunit
VAQISPIRLQANVADSDLGRVQVGAPVTIRSHHIAGADTTARITSITPAVDPVARTGIVEVVIPNRDRRFLPGQYVVLDLRIGEAHNVLRVPTPSVRWRTPPSSQVLSTRSTPFVWLAEPSGRPGEYVARAVDIQVGASNGELTEVLSGIDAGQQVVVSGHAYLRNGHPIAPVGAPSPPPVDPGVDPGPQAGHEGHGR